ncbi:hypothetical protein EKG35_16820 [Lysinibacillus telephonicus]|uniref:Uncharacterized protein n=1 Tax=Lysinibacillus telephonicus TaxID=1714840 RepID=A0A3S0QQU9_9BACI|nr:hypothetical protein EKG35_16820 [Lysinibacillus telephonicus]
MAVTIFRGRKSNNNPKSKTE